MPRAGRLISFPRWEAQVVGESHWIPLETPGELWTPLRIAERFVADFWDAEFDAFPGFILRSPQGVCLEFEIHAEQEQEQGQ